MTSLSPVLWHEGMHLAQHHFQLQSRYFEDSIHFAVTRLFYQAYGLSGIELDAEALRNGTVSVVHARGVMPDGLAFHCPEGDPAPQPLEIRERFSPTADSHIVYLAIPPHRSGHANEGADRRYRSEVAFVRDEVNGHDEREVHFGRKNFSLTLEPGDDVALPLARIRRDGAGHFIYDPDYIPPSLQIGASPRLMTLVSRLVEMLDAKSESMLQDRRSERKGVAEYASHEVANFWLAHTIHSSLAPLRYHRDTRGTHPEQLYVELARLAGALCTFALDSHPRNVPTYDHDNLGDCFAAMERHIRTHLEVIVPSSFVAIPLTKAADYLHNGAITDTRVYTGSRWILGIRSSSADADVITRVPALVKVCSQKHILRLVKEAYAGLTLEHIPAPPAAIAPRVGTHYFLIGQSGPCWDAIQKTGEVGVYVPDAFRDAEVELKVLT
ncbi:MAG TPA: type VI secretion system baseplate subunit TssK, partial [Gemmatimonadales bacterium]|nr:type VI secretion system baseplate subunit TssK [Gemmatimonadales bacterium]